METISVSGHDVLILGAGPIGLLAAQCASAEGATRIILADINTSRLELASQMSVLQCPLVTLNIKTKNLEQEIMSLTNGNGVARLVEATGEWMDYYSWRPLVSTCTTSMIKFQEASDYDLISFKLRAHEINFQILGAPSMVNSCFSLLRKGAKIVLIGEQIFL